MSRVCTTFIFLLAWLAIGSTASAGFMTVASDGILDSSEATLSSSASSAAPAEEAPKPSDDDRFPNWNADALPAGQSGMGTANTSYDAPSGSSFAAVTTGLPEFSTHLIRSLVVESQSRPPVPYLSGVFRPPRFVRA